MGNLFISIFVVVVILGGPLTIYLLINALNSAWGKPHIRFVKSDIVEGGKNLLALLITWDEELEAEVSRVKCEFYELVRGGRSNIFSFTFEDKSAKKRSFLLPMKLTDDVYKMLTDSAVDNSARGVNQSYVMVEIENPQGETLRQKIPKKKIQEALLSNPVAVAKEIEALAPLAPDSWSLLTRVFPWRAAAAVAVEAAPAPKGHAKKASPDAPREAVNFLVTKVWIEPGCIVCDACENEAPLVFQVLPDTCIVRDAAPLDDGAAIKAAAEGCPVDVIKFTTVPKPA